MNAPARHRQWRFLTLVAVGGAAGTAVRAGVGVLLPNDGFSAATFTVNLVGAFGLGLFLEALERLGSGGRAHVAAQLGIGTGFFGALTTYSTFALETAQLLRDGLTTTGILYAASTVIVGALVTAIGMLFGVLLHRSRRRHREDGSIS